MKPPKWKKTKTSWISAVTSHVAIDVQLHASWSWDLNHRAVDYQFAAHSTNWATAAHKHTPSMNMDMYIKSCCVLQNINHSKLHLGPNVKWWDDVPRKNALLKIVQVLAAKSAKTTHDVTQFTVKSSPVPDLGGKICLVLVYMYRQTPPTSTTTTATSTSSAGENHLNLYLGCLRSRQPALLANQSQLRWRRRHDCHKVLNQLKIWSLTRKNRFWTFQFSHTGCCWEGLWRHLGDMCSHVMDISLLSLFLFQEHYKEPQACCLVCASFHFSGYKEKIFETAFNWCLEWP